jgi:6-phosphogluconate dehydrogenase (decarboxylating)
VNAHETDDLMQHGERVHHVERQVSDLRVANAALSASVEHLAKTVDVLNVTVQSLRDTINQGRGAIWVMVGAAGAVGAVIATMIKRLFNLA